MKSIMVFLIVLMSSFVSNAQSDYTDIIYPSAHKDIITDCQITDVSEGNLISYKLKKKIFQVRAIFIKRDGEYIDLSEFVKLTEDAKLKDDLPNIDTSLVVKQTAFGIENTEDYQKYEQLYSRAVKKRSSGLMLTFGGAVFSAASYIMINNAQGSYMAGILFITGIVSFNVGVPLMISNTIKSNNNLKAMEQLELQTKAKLSFGLTNNGLGLVLQF